MSGAPAAANGGLESPAPNALREALAAKAKAEGATQKLLELVKQYKSRFHAALEHVKTAEQRAAAEGEAKATLQAQLDSSGSKSRSLEERLALADEELRVFRTRAEQCAPPGDVEAREARQRSLEERLSLTNEEVEALQGRLRAAEEKLAGSQEEVEAHAEAKQGLATQLLDLRSQNCTLTERLGLATEDIAALRGQVQSAAGASTSRDDEMRTELEGLRDRLAQPVASAALQLKSAERSARSPDGLDGPMQVAGEPPGMHGMDHVDQDYTASFSATTAGSETASFATAIELREKDAQLTALRDALARKTDEHEALREATAKRLGAVKTERVELVQKFKRLQDGFKESQRLLRAEKESHQATSTLRCQAEKALHERSAAMATSTQEAAVSNAAVEARVQRLAAQLAERSDAFTAVQELLASAEKLGQEQQDANQRLEARLVEQRGERAKQGAEWGDRKSALEAQVAKLSEDLARAVEEATELRGTARRIAEKHAGEVKGLREQVEERRKQSVDVIAKAKERLKAAAAAEAGHAQRAQRLEQAQRALTSAHDEATAELAQLREATSKTQADHAAHAEALAKAEASLTTQAAAFEAYKVRARAAIAKVTRGEQIAREEVFAAEQALEAGRSHAAEREAAVDERERVADGKVQELLQERDESRAQAEAERSALQLQIAERAKEVMELRQALAEAQHEPQPVAPVGATEEQRASQQELSVLKVESQTLRRQRMEMHQTFAKAQQEREAARQGDAAEIARLRQALDRLRERLESAARREAASAESPGSPASAQPSETSLGEARPASRAGPSEQTGGETSEDVIEAQPMQQLTALVQQEARADAYTTALAERASMLTDRLAELQRSYDALQMEHSTALDTLRNQVRGGELNREENEGVFRLTYLKQAVLAYMKCGKGKDTEREALIPVISRILLFTKSERKAALKAASELRASDTFRGFFGGS